MWHIALVNPPFFVGRARRILWPVLRKSCFGGSLAAWGAVFRGQSAMVYGPRLECWRFFCVGFQSAELGRHGREGIGSFNEVCKL